MDNRPIGVFDSGLGGLTVVRRLLELLPAEDIVYFGDTGRVPYGTRSRETSEKYAEQDCRFLMGGGVKRIIAACGTVSSTAPGVLERLPVPACGVVEPAADAALAAMGLEDARRTPLRRLTPAQRRRLSIAREIVRAPEVFYIEEPLAGQDAEGCRRILEWMDGVPSTGRCCIAATASTRTVYLLPGERYHLDGNGLERLEAAEESAAQGTAVEKIPAKAGETLLLFNPSDIDFAESASGRTALSVRGEEYACALTLEELSVRLERYGFFRCHRSYLVNMQKVQEVVRWTRNSYALRLENGPESGVPLSKGRIDAMRRQYRF